MPEELCSSTRPGGKALAVMKIVKDVDVFKKPVTPTIKIIKGSKPQKILDEDSYLQEMGKIIQRDFFPDLEKLKAQNEYLEAVERNDAQKLRELYLKYSSGKRPPTERYASPATFETPMDVRREEDQHEADTPRSEAADIGGENPPTKDDHTEENRSDNTDDVKLSLDEYLNSHTSEDNQSFQEIMNEAEFKHRQKFAWLYNTEENSEERKKAMLALPSIEEQASMNERPLMVDSWGYRNKNYIMYVPDGVSLTAEEKVEMASRRQSVVHNNTRLTHNPFDERQNKETIHQLAQSQAHTLEGKIGVDGKELTLSATPKVNGYSFVKTPSPAPGVSDTPVMTWGEIEGTPFRLDGGDTPVRTTQGPSFRIPEPPKREKLALALAEKAGERHRDRKLKAIETARKQLATPSPRPGTMERLNTMSPAAQRLASTQLRRLSSDRALQASYSPSPRPRQGTNTPNITPKTPNRTLTPRSKLAQAVKRTPNPNLTDNLLNLPKRPRAADFFGV